MERNFVEVILNAQRDEVETLLTLFKAFPESKKPLKNKRLFNKVTYFEKNRISKLEYYDDGLSELQLKELLFRKIKNAYKAKKTDDLPAIVDRLVRDVAKEYRVPFDEKMSTVEVENEILKKESKDNLPIYKLTLMSACYMSRSDGKESLVFLTRIKKLIKGVLYALRILRPTRGKSEDITSSQEVQTKIIGSVKYFV